MAPCSMAVYIYTSIVRLHMCVITPSKTAGSIQLVTHCSYIVHMQESTQLCLNSIDIIKETYMNTVSTNKY